jgi:hypothetical protein
MGLFTKASDIEQRRIGRFGRDSKIRFLRDDNDVNGLTLLYELLSHWYIVRKNNSETGGKSVSLVFDAIDGVDVTNFENDGFYVDLVFPNGNYERYEIQTESSPTATLENRYHLNLVAQFTNKTPIAE